MVNNGLIEYGIFNENSHIRAHVGPITRSIFVFKTEDMITFLKTNKDKFKEKLAYQDGVNGPTAKGLCTPCTLEFIRHIKDFTEQNWWAYFSKEQHESVKGKHAVAVVMQLMRKGLFPFWVCPVVETDTRADIQGTDIIVSGRWKVQVKCDFIAGPKELSGSGNLFIQTWERNPNKKY